MVNVLGSGHVKRVKEFSVMHADPENKEAGRYPTFSEMGAPGVTGAQGRLERLEMLMLARRVRGEGQRAFPR